MLVLMLPVPTTMQPQSFGISHCGVGAQLPFLAAHFGRVVTFRRRDLRDLTPFRGSFDVALAIDSILGSLPQDVDRILRQIHNSLVEGGVLLSTFPAVHPIGPPFRMRLGAEAAGIERFHEIELQYRMQRVGFQGIRVRRFEARDDRPATLFCIAARRANN